jgi:hypothetical protein
MTLCVRAAENGDRKRGKTTVALRDLNKKKYIIK